MHVITPLCDRTKEEKEAAQKADSRSHNELKQLLRRAENKECADCTASRPGWASLPHGVFICINCAQIHRHIGRHISQVKAINTGTYLWYPDEVDAMRDGNAEAARAYLVRGNPPPKPSEHAPHSVKEQYVRDKYEKKKWFQRPSTSPDRPASPSETSPPVSGRTLCKPTSSPSSLSARPFSSKPRMQSQSTPVPQRSTAVIAPPPSARATCKTENLMDLLMMDLRELEERAVALRQQERCPTGILIDFDDAIIMQQ
eukprot:CAMPEP_0114551502 /NCGR_PEP_ID=MMETSP0114-20121206/6639_1 /TAXON_ID=31324 /ORGANISM="Goniomonas sp, Strain m" /LENGTH=256 /DNA_ID=CAMNT_0001736343 /DNA_START=173 /DNA_END=944 /DNA_ORIENTATION=+